MDEKIVWSTNLGASKEETWSRGINSRLPFDVNVMLNLYDKKISVFFFNWKHDQYSPHWSVEIGKFPCITVTFTG